MPRPTPQYRVSVEPFALEAGPAWQPLPCQMGQQKADDPEKNDLGHPDSLSFSFPKVTAIGHLIGQCHMCVCVFYICLSLSLSLYIYIYMLSFLWIYRETDTHIHIYICIYTYIYIYIYLFIHLYIHVRNHMYKHMFVHV